MLWLGYVSVTPGHQEGSSNEFNFFFSSRAKCELFNGWLPIDVDHSPITRQYSDGYCPFAFPVKIYKVSVHFSSQSSPRRNGGISGIHETSVLPTFWDLLSDMLSASAG